jgi:branched-chain amino acid transport system substrate-binding protein
MRRLSLRAHPRKRLKESPCDSSCGAPPPCCFAVAPAPALLGRNPAARQRQVAASSPYALALFGNSARLGAELAVKEINEVGGFMGRSVELVARDDKSNPEVGRQVAEELISKEKVDFTVGFCNSGVALKALDLYQTHQHVLMVPVATGSAITTKYPARESFIFRMSARDSIQSAFLVDEVVLRRGLKKVAIFADRTGYGDGGLADLSKFLAAHKLEPVYVARFDLGVSSLTAEMQAAKDAGAEAVIAYTVGPELAVVANARSAAHFGGLLLGPWTLSFRTVWDKSSGNAEGALMTQTIVPDLATERRMSFMARLKRHTGEAPVYSVMAAAQTYDAVHLVVRAVFQAQGDTSGPALKKALENQNNAYGGVVTTHSKPFSSEDHDAFSANMIWLGTWHKGLIGYAYPEDAKRAAVIRRKE